MSEFDWKLIERLRAAGFTEIRRTENHIEVRRPESYHPSLQMIWFPCLESADLPVSPASEDGGWRQLSDFA